MGYQFVQGKKVTPPMGSRSSVCVGGVIAGGFTVYVEGWQVDEPY